MVDLAVGSELPDVAGETARVLGVRAPSETSLTEALVRYLADRDLLIVLDNCEHVIDACARLATALLVEGTHHHTAGRQRQYVLPDI